MWLLPHSRMISDAVALALVDGEDRAAQARVEGLADLARWRRTTPGSGQRHPAQRQRDAEVDDLAARLRDLEADGPGRARHRETSAAPRRTAIRDLVAVRRAAAACGQGVDDRARPPRRSGGRRRRAAGLGRGRRQLIVRRPLVDGAASRRRASSTSISPRSRARRISSRWSSPSAARSARRRDRVVAPVGARGAAPAARAAAGGAGRSAASGPSDRHGGAAGPARDTQVAGDGAERRSCAAGPDDERAPAAAPLGRVRQVAAEIAGDGRSRDPDAACGA